MSFTYDLSTDVGKVRLDINDKVESSAIFSDEEIEAVLEQEISIKRSSVRLLLILANDKARLVQIFSMGDLRFDASAKARELREQAKAMIENESLTLPASNYDCETVKTINEYGELEISEEEEEEE